MKICFRSKKSVILTNSLGNVLQWVKGRIAGRFRIANAPHSEPFLKGTQIKQNRSERIYS